MSWRYDNPGDVQDLNVNATYVTDLPEEQSRTGVAFKYACGIGGTIPSLVTIPDGTKELWFRFDFYLTGANYYTRHIYCFVRDVDGTSHGLRIGSSGSLFFIHDGEKASCPVERSGLYTGIIHAVSDAEDGLIELWLNGSPYAVYRGNVNNGEDITTVKLYSEYYAGAALFSNLTLTDGERLAPIASVESWQVERRINNAAETTGSIERRINNAAETTGSIERRISNVVEATGSIERRISNVVEATGSIERRISNVVEATGSIERIVSFYELLSLLLPGSILRDPKFKTLVLVPDLQMSLVSAALNEVLGLSLRTLLLQPTISVLDLTTEQERRLIEYAEQYAAEQFQIYFFETSAAVECDITPGCIIYLPFNESVSKGLYKPFNTSLVSDLPAGRHKLCNHPIIAHIQELDCEAIKFSSNNCIVLFGVLLGGKSFKISGTAYIETSSPNNSCIFRMVCDSGAAIVSLRKSCDPNNTSYYRFWANAYADCSRDQGVDFFSPIETNGQHINFRFVYNRAAHAISSYINDILIGTYNNCPKYIRQSFNLYIGSSHVKIRAK